MSIWKYISGAKRRVRFVWKRTASGWLDVSPVRARLGGADIDVGLIKLTISSSTSDYDVHVAAGSPAVPVTVEVTINSSVEITSGSSGNAAFDTGALPAGSSVRLINNGDILGRGGTGGKGAEIICGASAADGSVGGVGGDAINAQVNLVIDNTNGNIWSGGGGGGGGGAHYCVNTLSNEVGLVGGGGGGGANGGGGGGKGTTSSGAGSPTYCQTSPSTNAADGSAGTTTGGAGGTGSIVGAPPVNGGTGGAGGDYGDSGSVGANSSSAHPNCVSDIYTTNGGAGGAAGKAVELNGNGIAWLAGNNGSQVIGAVS